MRLNYKHSLFVVGLVFVSGCANPYKGRSGALISLKYNDVRKQSIEDLEYLGQPEVSGRISGTVSCSSGSYDTQYLHWSELAHRIIPLAYHDHASASYRMNRFSDAVRSAKNSIQQGSIYFSADKWAMNRLLNLLANYKILYESYLYLGNMEAASAAHKEYLALSKIRDSKEFKDVMANALCMRLTSLSLRSSYLAKQHWYNMLMILTLASTAASATTGDTDSTNYAVSQQVALAVMIAEMKHQLRLQHGYDLDRLMATAEVVNRFSPPSDEDIARAKRASSLYVLANARDVNTSLNTLDINRVFRSLKTANESIAVAHEDGKFVVTGDLLKLVRASTEIDEVPLRLSAPSDEDEFLSKYLTEDLYKMAGLSITDEEMRYFRTILKEGKRRYVFDPADGKSRILINGIRRMMQKHKEFEKWVVGI